MTKVFYFTYKLKIELLPCIAQELIHFINFFECHFTDKDIRQSIFKQLLNKIQDLNSMYNSFWSDFRASIILKLRDTLIVTYEKYKNVFNQQVSYKFQQSKQQQKKILEFTKQLKKKHEVKSSKNIFSGVESFQSKMKKNIKQSVNQQKQHKQQNQYKALNKKNVIDKTQKKFSKQTKQFQAIKKMNQSDFIKYLEKKKIEEKF